MDVTASRDSLGELAPAVETRRRLLHETEFAERLARRDATLWGAEHVAVASHRLGWVSAPADLRSSVSEITALAPAT